MIVIQLISFIRSQFPWLPFVKPLNARAGTNKYTSTFSNPITMVVIFSWQKVKTKVYKWPECRRVYCSTLLHLQLVDDKPIQFLALFENSKCWICYPEHFLSGCLLFWALFKALDPSQHTSNAKLCWWGWFVLSLSRDNSRSKSAVFFTTKWYVAPKQCFTPPRSIFQQRAVFYTIK